MKITDHNGRVWDLYGNKKKGLDSAAKKRGVTQERGPGAWLIADNGEVRHVRIDSSMSPTRASIKNMSAESLQTLIDGATLVIGPR